VAVTSITTVAEAFFEACETGKRWEVCSAYCTPDATFSAQAEPLLAIGLTITLADITEEEFRVLELIEAERHEQINSGDGGNRRSR